MPFSIVMSQITRGYLKKIILSWTMLGHIVQPLDCSSLVEEASQAGDTPQYLRPHPCDCYPPTQGPSQLGLYDDHARVKSKAMFNSYMLAMLYITAISAGSIPTTKGLRVLDYWCNQCKSIVLQQQLIVTVLMPHWKLEVCMYVYLVGGFNSSEKY